MCRVHISAHIKLRLYYPMRKLLGLIAVIYFGLCIKERGHVKVKRHFNEPVKKKEIQGPKLKKSGRIAIM